MTKQRLIKEYGCEPITLETEQGTINGLFSALRIDDDDIPNGLFKYEIRWDDAIDNYATIEDYVHINHAGTLLTDYQLDMNDTNTINIINH